MSIVFITIPGDTKREFVNKLHQQTGGVVELVIIQKPKKKTLTERAIRLYKHSMGHTFGELWYALLLRFNRRVRMALRYFREGSIPISSSTYLPKTIEVDSVNSDEMYALLKKISPTVLMAWGCTILEPRMLQTAKHSINLHFGYCPYYRGALANQYAVLFGDFSKIGATVHYMNEKPDAGDILTVIPANSTLKPKELFRTLNDEAMEAYLRIGISLEKGETLPTEKQDISKSKNFLLKSWTPKRRYELGKKIIAWEEKDTQ